MKPSACSFPQVVLRQEEAGTPIRDPHMDQGPKHLGCLRVLLLSHWQRAGLEMEQLELWLVLIWDAGGLQTEA